MREVDEFEYKGAWVTIYENLSGQHYAHVHSRTYPDGMARDDYSADELRKFASMIEQAADALERLEVDDDPDA